VKEEGKLVMAIFGDMTLDMDQLIAISLFLGGSFLEVETEAVNLMAQQIQLQIEVDYLLE
jgi:hypothetical protein